MRCDDERANEASSEDGRKVGVTPESAIFVINGNPTPCFPLLGMWRFLMHIVGLLLKNQHRGTLFLSSLCKIEHRTREIFMIKHTKQNLSSPISNCLAR